MARKPFSLRLSDEEREKLNTIAASLGREPATLLREILAKIAEQNGTPIQGPPDYTLKLEVDA